MLSDLWGAEDRRAAQTFTRGEVLELLRILREKMEK